MLGKGLLEIAARLQGAGHGRYFQAMNTAKIEMIGPGIAHIVVVEDFVALHLGRDMGRHRADDVAPPVGQGRDFKGIARRPDHRVGGKEQQLDKQSLRRDPRIENVVDLVALQPADPVDIAPQAPRRMRRDHDDAAHDRKTDRDILDEPLGQHHIRHLGSTRHGRQERDPRVATVKTLLDPPGGGIDAHDRLS